MSQARLTVIMPVCNGEPFVASAIKSVLNQTFKKFELWVLENGSVDRTAEIVRSITDPRLKLFELGPVGVQGALQYALENASTEWLARMDADDLMFPNRLETQIKFIRHNPKVVFVGTAYAQLTPFNHMFERVLTSGSREVTKSLLATMKRFFADPSIVFNRLAALDAGGADLEFTNIDGVPLLFRLLTRGTGWEIPEPLHVYRLRPHSLSKTKEHDRQTHLVRLKYAPESVAAAPKNSVPYSFWEQIAGLEVIGGDRKSARLAAYYMKQEGPFRSEANRMIARSLLGPVGRMYYSWRTRQRYRHRPDWENLFAPLLRPEYQAFAA